MFELHPARCSISTKMKIHAMNYINNTTTFQEALTSSAKYLMYPSNLSGFHNTETTLRRSMSGRNVFCHTGHLNLPERERLCSCGCRMHLNSSRNIYIRHLSIGEHLTCLEFPHHQLRCPSCGATKSQNIPFKAQGHMITEPLHTYTSYWLKEPTPTNRWQKSPVSVKTW